jgi:hypothetical protein
MMLIGSKYLKNESFFFFFSKDTSRFKDDAPRPHTCRKGARLPTALRSSGTGCTSDDGNSSQIFSSTFCVYGTPGMKYQLSRRISARMSPGRFVMTGAVRRAISVHRAEGS